MPNKKEEELWGICNQIARRQNPSFPFANEYQFVMVNRPVSEGAFFDDADDASDAICLICYHHATINELEGHAIQHLKERGLLSVM